MRSKCRESESCYNAGCRSDLCKQAATDARRERRQRKQESVGALTVLDTDRTNVVSMPVNNASTSVDAEMSVVAGVLEEIGTLESPRPDLVAIAIALAALMDNPKATSTKPAACGRLVQVLEKLHATASRRRTHLAVVRSMTSEKRT